MRQTSSSWRRSSRGNRAVSSAIVICLLGAMLMALMAGHARAKSGLELTNASGATVHDNHYTDKCQVHLTVQPRGHGSFSEDGPGTKSYYYQVTTPSGAVLLAGIDPPAGVPNTSHKLLTWGTGLTTPVQLCPFNDSPNQHATKAKYKLWVTEVSDFQPGKGSFGFVSKKSKTIEFQVRIPKHGDTDDDDGDMDGRPGHGGSHGGGGSGGNNGGANNGGGTGGTGGGTVGDIGAAGPLVTANKFYDTNANGLFDLGEPLLTGWKVVVTDPLLVSSAFFTPVGVSLSTPGGHRVDEITPQGSWLQTSLRVDGGYTNGGLPNQQPQSASFVFNNENHDVLFGNVCLGAGGARPILFWVSPSGETLMNNSPGNMSEAIALLINMNLRNAQGNHFDPASYSHLKTWLLAATTSNMAYILSAQLATLTLNAQVGSVSRSALVWTGLRFTTVDALILAANDELGLHGFTALGDPNRAIQEDLASLLSQANSNSSFVQTTPCSIRY